MPKPKLIALYSSAPQSGKSTVAGYLTSKGYDVFKFAQPIKDMLIMLLMHAGISIPLCRQMVDGDLKDQPIPHMAFRGQTPRDLLKSLGTKWGRNTVYSGLWTGLLIERVKRSKNPVVVDDMRLPEEYDFLKGLGATMVRIDRPLYATLVPTDTEGNLDLHDFDVVLDNGGTLSDLRDSVYKMVG